MSAVIEQPSILTKTKYEFEVRNLGAFMGSNGFITRKSDGKTVEINRADHGRLMKINVKDHKSYYVIDDPEVGKLVEDLDDDLLIEHLYDSAVRGWWEYAKHHMVEDTSFTGCYQEGRSGGWIVIEGTELLSENFSMGGYDSASSYPESPYELFALREEFVDLAFDLVGMIESEREDAFYDAIRDQHQLLESRRKSVIILGEE